MVAANKGHLSIVEVLLESGVDVNYKHQVNLCLCTSYAARQWITQETCIPIMNRQWGGLQSSLLQRMVE